MRILCLKMLLIDPSVRRMAITACHFPRVSFIEGFRTPATVQAASLPSAGIRNPQQCLNNYKRLRLMKAISQLR